MNLRDIIKRTVVGGGIVAGLVGCAAVPAGGEGGDAFFPKADDNFDISACQTAEVLALFNSAATDADILRQAMASTGLTRAQDAADAAIARRNGPDGVLGTWDDQRFRSLNDLVDSVAGIGQGTAQGLAESFKSACEVDLSVEVDWSGSSDLPFMSSASDTTQAPSGWTRSNREIELALTIHGVDSPQLLAALQARPDPDDDDVVFDEVADSREMEAFNYTRPVDEMPWDKRSHAAREGYPLIAVGIEANRYSVRARSVDASRLYPEEPPGSRDITVFPHLERRLNLGRDYMTDTYYDTRDYLLHLDEDNPASVRGRMRWDTPNCVRRMLVAAKFGSGVPDRLSGIKNVLKVDVRSDAWGTGDQCQDQNQRMWGLSMDADIRRGFLPWWQSAGYMVEPVRQVFVDHIAAGSLPSYTAANPMDPADTRELTDVMALEPRAYLYSIRKRFHFDEAPLDRISALYGNGRTRLDEVIRYIDQADPAADWPEAQALKAQYEAALAELPSSTSEFQNGQFVSDVEEIVARAEAASATLHASSFALGRDWSVMELEPGQDEDELDARDLERQLTGATDERVYERAVEAFVFWRKAMSVQAFERRPTSDFREGQWALQNSEVVKTTLDVFRDFYVESMSDDSDPDTLKWRDQFQAFAAAARDDERNPYHKRFRRFEELTSDGDWEMFERQLDYEWLKIVRRQIAGAGTAARQLALDATRAAFVPESRRSSGNFMIDTMDLTGYFSPREWNEMRRRARIAAFEADPSSDTDGDGLSDDPEIDLLEGMTSIPAEHASYATLVNELQIELTNGWDVPFVNALGRSAEQLTAAAASDTALHLGEEACSLSHDAAASDEELLALLSEPVRNQLVQCRGIQHVFKTYQDALTYLGQLKGERVMDIVRDAIRDHDLGERPARRDVTWGASDYAKGQMSLRLLTGRLY